MKQLLFLVALAAPLVSAQWVDTSSLPACASSCANLVKSQQVCPSGDKVCFCQTNYFQPSLYFQPYDPVCPDTCSPGDDATIKRFLYNFCAANIPPGGVAPTNAASGTGSGSNPSASSGVTSGGEYDGSENGGQSWWEAHDQWIAMVIVLLIGFGLIIWGSLWLKKRHARKRNAAEPPPPEWGPRQSQHYSGNLNVPGDAYEKSAAAEAVPSRTESKYNTKSSGGNRLTKLLHR